MSVTVAVRKQKTIRFSVLKRLSFCNSGDLPKQIEIRGKVRGKTVVRYMWWTGIGWADLDHARHEIKNPVLVVEDTDAQRH